MPGDTPASLFKSEEELARLPASERIRYRLVGAQRRYHANDNISAYVREGELDELRDEVASRLQEVLKATQPDKSQMVKAIDVIGLHIKALHSTFKKVWDREKAAGRDPGKGSWAWFDHELHAGTDAIRYTARGLLIEPPVQAPAADEPAPQSTRGA